MGNRLLGTKPRWYWMVSTSQLKTHEVGPGGFMGGPQWLRDRKGRGLRQEGKGPEANRSLGPWGLTIWLHLPAEQGLRVPPCQCVCCRHLLSPPKNTAQHFIFFDPSICSLNSICFCLSITILKSLNEEPHKSNSCAFPVNGLDIL